MKEKPNWLNIKQKIMNMDMSLDITDIAYAFDSFRGTNHFYIFFGKNFDISKMEEIKDGLQCCDEKHKCNFVFFSCALKEEELKRIEEMYGEVHLLR
jgi:ABC-type uncharacterized transport system ATPase subunit